MNYEESKLFSLLKKQDIDSLFLEATNYLCQTKSLFEEKERLQQENQQLKEKLDCDLQWAFKYEKQVDNWNKLKEWASNFYNSEEVGWAGCGMRYTLEKILELENETANNCNDCKQCKGSDNNG